MTVQLSNERFTDAMKRTGASVTKNNTDMYKNFLNPKVTEGEGKDSKYYRMRLLFFKDPTNERTIPFVEQYNHVHYERDENNKLSIDFVTCPTSPYLHIENAWVKCPICQYANKQYELAKESEWKNKTAMDQNHKFRRTFVAFIPVYVLDDPNEPANTGRVMLLKLRDRDAYKKLADIIKAKEHECCVFNGNMAVDLAMTVKKRPQKDKDGNVRTDKQGKAYTYTDYGFFFGKKPYTLEIPMEQIESLGFDENIFTFSSESDLKAFLKRYTIGSQIPDEDFSISLTDESNAVSSASDFGLGSGKSESSPLDDIDVSGLDLGDGKESADSSVSEFDMGGSSPEVTSAEKTSLLTDEIDVDGIMDEINGMDDYEDDIPF